MGLVRNEVAKTAVIFNHDLDYLVNAENKDTNIYIERDILICLFVISVLFQLNTSNSQ